MFAICRNNRVFLKLSPPFLEIKVQKNNESQSEICKNAKGCIQSNKVWAKSTKGLAQGRTFFFFCLQTKINRLSAVTDSAGVTAEDTGQPAVAN